MESQIDLSYIEEVACGDQKMINELILDIIELIEESSLAFQKLLRLEDFSGIASTAHKLKAPIQMVGATFFYEKVEELERSAKSDPNLDKIMPIYTSFETLSHSCRQSLVNIVNEKK